MRSKTLLVSNLLNTIYSAILLWVFGGAVISAGGFDYIGYWKQYFELAFELVGYNSVSLNLLYAIIILLIIHIVVFVLGMIMGWIGFLSKKSGPAKFAAVLYLIGTILFPIYIVWGLPLTIIGFVGSRKQKELKALAE